MEKDESKDTEADADADSEDADEEETKTVTTYYVNDQEADSDAFKRILPGSGRYDMPEPSAKKIQTKATRNLHFPITEQMEVKSRSPIRREIPVSM